MKAVVGLGNPGQRYRNTRHNVGFEVLAELAKRHDAGKPSLKFDAEMCEVFIGSQKTLLVSPLTYMNASGKTVRQLVDFYDLPLADLLVICDDMNLDTGRLRLRGSGSAGGQNGLNDIIRKTGDQSIPRLRIGIGRPPGRMSSSDYVLGRFRDDEQDDIQHAVVKAADGVELWVDAGLELAMNRVNVKPETES